MTASRCCRESGWLASVSALTVLLGLVGQAHAEPEAQAELTALLASGNLLRGPEPEAPPWEGLASPRSGAENRARLALATSHVGFLPGVTTLALLRLDLGLDALARAGAAGLRDASSFVSVAWRVTAATTFKLQAFPFDTDYLRVGYLHALDWGGTDVARRESTFLRQTGGAPGLRLGLETRPLRLFLAVKWATATDALRGQRRLWGGLAGGSFGLGAGLTLDAGFGYFQRPAPASSFLEGASLRLVWHHRVAEPELGAEPFRPPSLREDPEQLETTAAPGFALALEAVTLVAHEQRFDSPNTQILTAAPAGAVYGSIRGRWLSAHAAFTWRSLAFVLRNDPRAAPGEGPPLRAAALPELTAWVGASLSEAPVHLVPSFEVGVRLPAALETPSSLSGFTQTLVAGGSAGFEALPVGAGRLPVVTARLGARFPASPTVALALFGEYERNSNRTSFGVSSAGVTRAFASPDALSVFSAALARF
jgi:hypothetical protein